MFFSASVRDRAVWTVYSAVGVLLLLATTNELTREIAPVPLLWTIPLSVYLVTFIICFERDTWFKGVIFYPLLGLSLVIILYLQISQIHQEVWVYVLCYSLFLFSACMVLHGELARQKPSTGLLTEFYLFVSFGGALGGIVVNFAAPLFFYDYFEFEACFVLLILMAGYSCASYRSRHRTIIGCFTIVFAVATTGFFVFTESEKNNLVTHRNFYGVLKVVDVFKGKPSYHRKLLNDDVNHGSQFQADAYKNLPTTYFSYKSGVGVALIAHTPVKRRVGVIGLGSGTLAAYGQSGDEFRFYEINPEVIDIANEYFTYLGDSAATIEVVTGDARASIEADLGAGRRLDLLVIDAFSGDSIPTHLLTEEAWQLYWRILKEDGVLVAHVSNKYIDLVPVVRHHNNVRPGFELRQIRSQDDDSWDIYSANWLIQSANKDFLQAIEPFSRPVDSENQGVIWSDEKSSVVELLR